MNILIILSILLLHYIGDFILQTDKQAKNKSTSNIYLLKHVITYLLVWIIPLFYITSIQYVLTFLIITFVSHFCTDYFTSRINSSLYKQGKIHMFFISVGADQLLHYTQLLLTAYYLRIIY